MIPRVWRCKRVGGDIIEGDITEVRVWPSSNEGEQSLHIMICISSTLPSLGASVKDTLYI